MRYRAALTCLLAAGLATAVAMPVGAAPGPPPAPSARITGADWLGPHRVDLTVFSPAMGTAIKVQVLLPKDWSANPKAVFPTLYLLDGMRAQDDSSGWLLQTNAADFYADKNVTVVLPVGGQSSWYTDWERPDNGKNYKWETFLARELPPVLKGAWRSTDVRGAAGVSMGGTAAYTLAARNPGLYRFAGSYSGILSTSSTGTPQAIALAMRDAGGFNADAMWGPPTDPAWTAHDPLKLADKLRGVSMYFSSGSGQTGPDDVPGDPNALQAMALEVLSRASNQDFAVELNRLGIPAQAVYRPSGTHTWPYWQFENTQAWPQAKAALGVPDAKPCAAGGAIGDFVRATPAAGGCVSDEYAAGAGRGQDFRGGQVLWGGKTGAQLVGGAIGGAYVRTGGATGPLGLPISAETGTPDKKGRYQKFEHGIVYWTAQTGAHLVTGAIGDKFAAIGYERSPLGYPTSDETAVRGGVYTAFQGGNIYWSPKTGAVVVNSGAILQEWGRQGYEGGRLGLPVADAEPIAGGFAQRFEHGVIELVNGVVATK
jgi:S-formylglutathione hydrolase FrmB